MRACSKHTARRSRSSKSCSGGWPLWCRIVAQASGFTWCNRSLWLIDCFAGREHLTLVQKGSRPGVHGRRLVEMKSGDSLSGDGTWAQTWQVVDRVNRRYRKRVVAADGTVIRDVDKPLEEHQGHGSAAPRVQPTSKLRTR
jgi:hypothetical protein